MSRCQKFRIYFFYMSLFRYGATTHNMYRYTHCQCFYFSINVEFPKGSLTAIVGQVGSGKSSLISSILGELNRVKGVVRVSVRGILQLT